MFEKITIRQQSKTSAESPIDIGFLLEAMLFYKKVVVISIGPSVLKQLLTVFGIDNITNLIDRGNLEISYSEAMYGIFSKTPDKGQQFHKPVTFTSPQHTFGNELDEICQKIVGKSGKGRRIASRIRSKIRLDNLEDSLSSSVKDALLNQQYIRSAVHRLMSIWAPEIDTPERIIFETEMGQDGIIVKSNMDYGVINKLYNSRIPASHSSISDAYILSSISNIETDLYYAARNISEIASESTSSKLIDLRMVYLANRCRKSQESIDSFQDLVYSKRKRIREHFNAGKLKIDEILSAIYAADKFKDWLSGKPFDADLIQAYHNEVARGTIIDKLPSKAVRWSAFTGAGMAVDAVIPTGIGTATGLGLSIFDSFILDKWIQGWRPNQFISDHMEKLIDDGDGDGNL